MQLNLLVLRARDPSALAAFYGNLGLSFAREKHGSGPEHMACETGAGVFEIYPLTAKAGSTTSVRLGFEVKELARRCQVAAANGGRLVNPPHKTTWGLHATIEDPEGHIIDLLEPQDV